MWEALLMPTNAQNYRLTAPTEIMWAFLNGAFISGNGQNNIVEFCFKAYSSALPDSHLQQICVSCLHFCSHFHLYSSLIKPLVPPANGNSIRIATFSPIIASVGNTPKSFASRKGDISSQSRPLSRTRSSSVGTVVFWGEGRDNLYIPFETLSHLKHPGRDGDRCTRCMALPFISN